MINMQVSGLSVLRANNSVYDANVRIQADLPTLLIWRACAFCCRHRSAGPHEPLQRPF
jgi:hypothetical protein